MHQLIDKKNKIIIYLLILFILSTTTGKFVENQSSYFPKINQINIEGISSLNSSKIYNELNDLLYKNILLIEKEELQKVISKYNIIEEYSIKKIYPSTININIKATEFVARISNNDKLFVGANGKLIKNKENNEILPYMFGEFNSDAFLVFKKGVEESKFVFTKFKTLFFFPSNRWDILTNKGILIKLPQYNIVESLNLAYKIINNDELKNINLIDLRVNNHLIIK
jgi:cell division protein FtsQ